MANDNSGNPLNNSSNSGYGAVSAENGAAPKRKRRMLVTKKQIIVSAIGSGLVAITAITALVVGLLDPDPEPTAVSTESFNISDRITYPDPETKPEPSESLEGHYRSAAIALDAETCAQIGGDVLRKGGTAVDAAVASMLCNGVLVSHSTGVGGGFLMTIYNSESNEIYVLNSREVAPLASTTNMYENDTLKSLVGPLAMAVPAEIAGFWEAKARFGNKSISWASLLEPTIKLCEQGITVSQAHAKRLEDWRDNILAEPTLSVFVNKETNDTWKEGDVYTRPVLAKTLRRIAENGLNEFYGTGETARNLVQDIQRAGGIITLEDLQTYKPEWLKPVELNIGQHKFYSVPPPGSGSLMLFMLNILQHFNIDSLEDDQPLLYHRIAEAFKYVYGVRDDLGDPNDPEIRDQVNNLVASMTSELWGLKIYQRINDTFTVNNSSYYGGQFLAVEDHGTSHASFLAENGDAVALTSTVNGVFGCQWISESTGILLNNQMNDFSVPGTVNLFGVPPSPANFIKPGKRPFSSMSPTIVVNGLNNQVELVVGGSGGTKITTATAYTTLRKLWLGETLKQAVDARRIHHQLEPMQIDYEIGLTKDITDFLASVGHVLNRHETGQAVVNAVYKDPYSNKVWASADFRKDGRGIDGY